jgi:hypothetical protein
VSLRDDVERLERSAAALVNHEQERIWAQIEKAADAIVEKASEPLTREAATARYLNTPAGKEAYGEYVAAQARARDTIEKADQAVAQRGLERWAEEEFRDLVEKAERAGFDRERALNFARERRPELWPLVGRSTPERVQKAATRERVRKEELRRFYDDLVADDRPRSAQEPHSQPERVEVRKDAAREPVALEGGYIFVDLDDE